MRRVIQRSIKKFLPLLFREFRTRPFEFHHARRRIQGYDISIHKILSREKYLIIDHFDRGARVWRLGEQVLEKYAAEN